MWELCTLIECKWIHWKLPGYPAFKYSAIIFSLMTQRWILVVSSDEQGQQRNVDGRGLCARWLVGWVEVTCILLAAIYFAVILSRRRGAWMSRGGWWFASIHIKFLDQQVVVPGRPNRLARPAGMCVDLAIPVLHACTHATRSSCRPPGNSTWLAGCLPCPRRSCLPFLLSINPGCYGI